MNRIKAVLTGSTLRFSLVSAVIAGLFVFAVIPALPNITNGEGLSLSALVSFADSDGGGDGGDGGSDGGGDGGSGGLDGGGDGGGGDTGGGTGGDNSGGDTTPPPPPVPVCTLSSNPMSIATGNSATLTWTTSNASNVSINQNIGGVALNGSKSVSPAANTTYTLTATGDGGTVTCTASIAVTYPPSTNSCTEFGFDFDIAKYDWNGSSFVKTTYRNDYVTSGTGNQSVANWTSLPAAGGIVAKAGTTFKTLSGGTSGTIRASEIGAGQNGISHFHICGNTPKPAPVCTLGANPTSITSGQSSVLTWTTQNATNVSLNQGIGTVSTNGTRSVSPTSNTTYTLTATGDGGTVTCSAPITVTQPPAGQCVLTITKSVSKTTAQVGDTLTYTLNFKNVGTANCTGGGVRVVDVLPTQVAYMSETHSGNVTAGYGSTPVYDSMTHTVTWNADTLTPGESGTTTITARVKTPASCGNYSFENRAKITSAELNNFSTWVQSPAVKTDVTNACPHPAPVCTLSVSPDTITRGASTTLTWTTQNATNVSLNQGIGTVSTNGTRSVSPTTNTTYTLTATGEGGTVTCEDSVIVNEPEPEPNLSCDAFTAAPQTLSGAGTTTLTWATTDATNVSIDNGVGTVSADGSKNVFVSANTTFTLTATRGSETKTCSVPVTIVPNVIVPKCDAFNASPSSGRNGTQATLTWATTDATNVSIDNGIGAVDADGSRAVTIDANRTYVLTAVNGGATTTCQTSVSLESSGGGGGGGGGSSNPRCELTASDTTIKAGEKVTLTWKNSRTDEIVLEDNRGSELIDTKERADDREYDEDGGKIVVTPTRTTEYTLTAYNGSKKRTCEVEIKVENVSVSSTRSNTPLVAGISLSRLPYTGFDAGPFLTTVFYTLLVLWALVVAYFLVIRRESVLGISIKEKKEKFAGAGAYLGGSIESAAVIPMMTTSRVTAPEVSRMEYVPSVLTPPRKLPHGDMASKYAPVGYEALYEDYGDTAPVVEDSTTDIPNLPIGEPMTFAVEVATDDTELLENRAHEAYVLISTDALNFIMAQSRVTSERIELLDMVIGAAKANFPKEDGWVVVNKDRIMELLK
jgi:uncharacterized repeat protein (TIGR01451 family)